MPADPPTPTPRPPSGPQPADPAGARPADLVFSTTRHADSPAPPHETWRGVLIKAPDVVRIDPRAPAVVIRGVYVLNGTQMPDNAAMKIVVTDVQSKVRREERMGQRESSPEEPRPPAPPLDPKLRERLIFNGHFNVELFATVGLPVATASYIVHARIGPNVSNEIAIKVLSP